MARAGIEQFEEAEKRLYEIAESGRYDGGFQRFENALTAAIDMAANAYFAHDDLSRTWSQRIRDCGYGFNAYLGENIAAGQASLEEAIRDWLLSAGHCVNMIDERFTEFGIAKVASTRQDDPYGVYWTLVLGQPRDGQVARR